MLLAGEMNGQEKGKLVGHVTDAETGDPLFAVCVFIGNSIFDFRQWQGTTHNGWEAQRRGYIPEEVASYAMALFNKYQNNQTTWTSHLNKGIKKMFEKNLKFLNSSEATYKFK